MTQFFQYDELTWPEVAALPRDMPLVLPLGIGYKLDRLAEILGFPNRIGLLPAIPFGWRTSSLPIEPTFLAAYVSNLVSSLVEDGFIQVYLLTPPDQDLIFHPNRIILPLQNRLSPPGLIPTESDRETVVIIPIGHTEQHSYHLPLSTDTIIIEAIANGVIEKRPDLAVMLPVMPYGVSTHRSAFAGTMNAGGRAFEDFWLAVLETLVLRGFSRFYLMSGHGGNSSFLTNIVKYAGERFYQSFIATAWLYLSGPAGVSALEAHRQSGRGGMGHACELETSLLLQLRPDLVRMERVVDEIDFISTPSYFMDWVEGGALIANPPWEDDVRAGAYGAGSLGTPQKGEIWLEAAIMEKIGHVSEIHDQYIRRIARRKELANR